MTLSYPNVCFTANRLLQLTFLTAASVFQVSINEFGLSVLQGFQRHHAVTGKPPDAVVYSSFLWDLQTWGRFEPEKRIAEGLEIELLDEWTYHFEDMLSVIKVRKSVMSSTHVSCFMEV